MFAKGVKHIAAKTNQSQDLQNTIHPNIAEIRMKRRNRSEETILAYGVANGDYPGDDAVCKRGLFL